MGTGFFVPGDIVTNADVIARGLDSTPEWIMSHTGIRARRMAAATQATSDLAVEAARSALLAAGLLAGDLAFIVCATSTPDSPLPSTAALIAHRLGSQAGAIDLNAGCSGFAYALIVGMSLQRTLTRGHVLVIGADTYSRCLDWQDRGSAYFFGDGAGAAVLGHDEDDWMLGASYGSDGSGARAIEIPAGGSRLPATVERVQEKMTRFRMRGREVAEFVRYRFPLLVRDVVERSNLRMSDVALLIPHQANERLLGECIRDMGLARERVFLNMRDYANTAAASIAIALAEAVQMRRIRAGDVVVLAGFGAGLSWAALCLRWGATSHGVLP
jgi:3-oxoacyl-[acyl-carrier-protein] synthase-3